MEQELTYSEAIAELKELVANIESAEVSIDKLEAKSKRASKLLGICKAFLMETEDRTNEILAKLDEEKNK
jgi:exodeoxyribonuclease VII small subunit